jgi:hypothetical protein
VPYRDPKDPRRRIANMRYDNTEKGFVTNRISSIYKPSRILHRGYEPKLTKEEMWAELFLHVEEMKLMFPESNGRLCYYCFQPWTYITHRNDGKDRENTNFSIDRLDNNKTYEKGNIIFCCHKCNDAKHSITFKLIDRIQEIRNAKKNK